MHVFVTGATGWVGSVIVRELLDAGHRVTGLARSEEKADALRRAGAEALLGTLDDHETLAGAASDVEAVIHTAFDHDFSKFVENARQDRRAIETFGAALEGSDKPLIVTSGLGALSLGRPSTEKDETPADSSNPRQSEIAVRAFADRGVRASTIRLAPSVHGIGDHGFVPILIRMARETGVSAYIGDGENRWPAVHRLDAGRLYRVVLEHGAPKPIYHAVAEDGIAFRDIAEAIGRGLGVPVEPREPDHFGWFASFAGGDFSSSSRITRDMLGWQPTGPSLLEDLARPEYYNA
ncbi:SDR family oxidoreductase [Aurantiacibacter flavus]|uniref:SDR family oxidoreductase n=1 Tax=Aurantiacibacter flavus TaxID=3145232 RepID=A0ABV0CZD3_9SPHN